MIMSTVVVIRLKVSTFAIYRVQLIKNRTQHIKVVIRLKVSTFAIYRVQHVPHE